MNRYCAKGGHEKEPHSRNYVCGTHIDTEGHYTHCSECGQPLTDDGRPVRWWKHPGCLVNA